jgi:ABC-type antimicrobial peptide transport system permease subunit
MLEIIKEIGKIITALIVILGTVYSVYNTYQKNTKMIIQKHKQEQEYEYLKKSVTDNQRNILKIELLLLINNKSSKELVLQIFDKYQKLHGNSYIKELVHDYCDDTGKPLF